MPDWLVSLHSAFAADFLTLRADLDRAHQESLVSERTAHAAEREKLAQALSTTEAAAARNAQATKWRLQALDLLAHEFSERHAAKARVQAWTAWRAHLARRGHDRFKEHIAALHAEKQAKFRIVVAWRSVVRDRWRRAERAKMKAEFDRQLADRVAEHTTTVASLMQQLTEHADLLAALEQRHRDREDGIRMAFMRGLSALNLETMTVLQDPPPPHDCPASPRPASPTPAAAAVPWASPPGSFHGLVPDPALAASTALRMSALVSPRESQMTSWQEAVDEELQQAVLAQRRSPSPDAVQHGPRPARVVKAPPGVAEHVRIESSNRAAGGYDAVLELDECGCTNDFVWRQRQWRGEPDRIDQDPGANLGGDEAGDGCAWRTNDDRGLDGARIGRKQ
ncbi:Centrosomal protein poc5 [Allomyces arbusculus]|nr:Centrosomal protein poc5 [Allomyces arbusculus]